MNAPIFSIGDQFKRSDHYNEGKIYTIDRIIEHNGTWLYHAVGQTWVNGWNWIAEFNMKKVEA